MLRTIHTAPVALAALLTTGCAGSFSGDIDGSSPFVLSALFGRAELDDDVHVTTVHAFSFVVDCDKYATWVEDKNDIMADYFDSDREDDDIEDAALALEDADRAFGLPEEGWSITVFATTDGELEDDDFDAFGDDVAVSFGHKVELTDYEELVEDGEDKSLDSYIAIDGEVTFEGVSDDALRLATDEIVLAEAEDVADDGDDADEVGAGTLSLSATHCEAFSDVLQDVMEDALEGPSDPNEPNEPNEPGCAVAEECPNIACMCDDGSEIGTPVNTRNCVDSQCEAPPVACPATCEAFGLPWTGQADVSEEPPPEEPVGGEESTTCGTFIGGNDGCDCGCGVFDPDCSATTADVCGFNQCVSGAPDPNDNTQCI